MAFTSTLSLYSHPQPQVRLRHQRLQSLPVTAARFVWLPILKTRRSHALVVRSASSVEGTPSRAAGSRTVYRESQANAPLSVATVKQIATAVAPFGVFFALTFVIWKLAEKLLVPTPKESKSSTVESQSTPQGLKWSFFVDSKLSPHLEAELERQFEQELNLFAQDLTSSPRVDVTGYYSGGTFFLEEDLEIDQELLRYQ